MREFIIFSYLLAVRVFFTLFKSLPLADKVVFLCSFADNPMAVYEALKQQKLDVKVVFLCNRRCFLAFKATGVPTFLLESRNVVHTIIGFYHLATARRVIVDNYYGLLASTKFKKGVTCTQIWHSVGAIKQFGAKDLANANRHPVALKRFKRVYHRFDYIVVASDLMMEIFTEAFLVEQAVFLKTGTPRTDFFFQTSEHEILQAKFYRQNPLLKAKKVILYAPTFRKNRDEFRELPINLPKLAEALACEYVLLIKLHPKVAAMLTLDLEAKYQDFVFDYSDYPSVNELLVITDVLITDYSSIPMEFVFFRRKMVFFAYDSAEYQKNNGLWEDLTTALPGPIVNTTEAVIEAILNEEIDLIKLDAYAKKWTTYCDGTASFQLINAVFGS